jgi:hypothetical protein
VLAVKHKTWFRLVVKAIGITLLGFAAPELVDRIATYIAYRVQQQSWGTPLPYPEWLGSLLHVLGPLLQTAAGAYLLFGGDWLVNKAIPSNRPYCPECGYDLSKNSNDRCPECGVALANESGARS